MHKVILKRFFEGKTSIEDERFVRKWMSESEENIKIFIKERFAYDSILLSDFNNYNTNEKELFIRFTPWVASAVAAFTLLLIVSGLYIFNIKNESIEYNTILVPPGQRINIILADHTNVWLNANSQFKYPTNFSKKERIVYLDGEAYFDVSENKKNYFTVKTNVGDVRATGTKFNVEAYSKNGAFEASLFEGGIDIYREDNKLVSLNPNEKCSFSDDKLTVSKIIDTDEYLWIRGLIAFNNKRLDEILLSLEKYYDTEIRVDLNSLPDYTYSGKFRQSDGIDYALRVLQRNIKFNYDRDDESNTIYIK